MSRTAGWLVLIFVALHGLNDMLHAALEMVERHQCQHISETLDQHLRYDHGICWDSNGLRVFLP